MRLNLSPFLVFAGIGVMVALVATIAALSLRVFLADRTEHLVEPPAEVVPEIV